MNLPHYIDEISRESDASERYPFLIDHRSWSKQIVISFMIGGARYGGSRAVRRSIFLIMRLYLSRLPEGLIHKLYIF